ncbi:hypothetical protein DPMN_058879, partial [Dreissena polymorpha]
CRNRILKAFANSLDPDENVAGDHCEIFIKPVRNNVNQTEAQGSCPLLREDFSLKDSMITVNWVMRVVYRVIS